MPSDININTALNLRYLFYGDLQRIRTSASPRARYEPTLASSEVFSCPICFEYKPEGMVLHASCMKMYCASCVIELLDQATEFSNISCPNCRGCLRIQNNNPLSQSTFIRPTPNDCHFMDKILYECDACSKPLTYEETKTHDVWCDNVVRHQPIPFWIPKRGAEQVTRFEVISNPFNFQSDCATTDSRLTCIHFNGQQIVTKFLKASTTGSKIKDIVHNLTDANVSELKILKFTHREMCDNDRLREVATSKGINHLNIVSTTKFTEPQLRTANLILEEYGQKPYFQPTPDPSLPDPPQPDPPQPDPEPFDWSSLT